ncbi:MAG: rubredoxin [Burkholderiaceae bacterium]|nr:rubredoxin [Burkholderiaceae bacterium]
MKVYGCVVCGLVYDQVAGRPEGGIVPGTPWSEVPETWRCPECNVGKADFVLMDL